MNAMNTYLAIAEKDLEAADVLKRSSFFNQSAKLYQQFLEKTLKHIIDCNTGTVLETDVLLLKSHNLVRLAERVEDITGAAFHKDDMAWLRVAKDYYFEVGYPGDAFIEVTKAQIDDLSSWIKDFAIVLQSLVEKQQQTEPVDFAGVLGEKEGAGAPDRSEA